MSHVVRSSQGWFSRVGSSVKGFFVGLLLVLGAVALLAWNEHRTLKTTKGLKQGEQATQSVPAERVDGANAGKLVHVSGQTQTSRGSADPEFELQREALALRREVKMYQWQEKKTQRKETSVGGTETTVTEYTYSKGWDDELIDSSRFHAPAGHANPGSMPVRSQRFYAADATLGAFSLDSERIARIGGLRDLNFSEVPYSRRAAGWIPGHDGELYLGRNPADPQIGDVRVRFRELPTGPLTVVAAQDGNGFAAWKAPNGVAIDLLLAGTHSIKAMFDDAHSSNSMLAWALRGGGFVLMWIGFAMTLDPLRVLASVIPFLGRIVGGAGKFLSFLLATVLASIVIIISWLAVRPLLVIGIVAACVGLFMLLGRMRARSSAAPPMQPPVSVPGYVQPRAAGAYIPDPPAGPPPPPPR